MAEQTGTTRSNTVLIAVVAAIAAAVALLAILAASVPRQSEPALQINTDNAKVSIGNGGISVSIAPSAAESSP